MDMLDAAGISSMMHAFCCGPVSVKDCLGKQAGPACSPHLHMGSAAPQALSRPGGGSAVVSACRCDTAGAADEAEALLDSSTISAV